MATVIVGPKVMPASSTASVSAVRLLARSRGRAEMATDAPTQTIWRLSGICRRSVPNSKPMAQEPSA
ncbi:hypothetical protein D3C77_790300 [compost metagenome]